MDAKSLAKSKRAHSQHHQNKRTHPNSKPKPTTTTTTTTTTSAGPNANKQQKFRQFRGSSSALPSNWDRYEDDVDSPSASGDVPIGWTSQATDVVVPKSKGADFAYLISEAQSQLETRCTSAGGGLDTIPSFDDVLPDFNQGVSSMLSVRGKSILSWIGDDNFIVDDNSTTGSEASFLSMDLDALAAQLAKLDVSRRLFIEEDILPPELHADRSKKLAETCAGVNILGSANAEKVVDSSWKDGPSRPGGSYSRLPQYSHQGTEVVDPLIGALYSTAATSTSSAPPFHHQGDKSFDIVKDEYNSPQQIDSRTGASVSPTDSKEAKTSTFDAMTAETELDMLLNSFGEAKLLDSSGISEKSANNSPIAQQASSFSRDVPLNVNLDDTLDDLLKETSLVKSQNDASLHSLAAAVTPYVPATSSLPTIQVLDDFDSWLDTI